MRPEQDEELDMTTDEALISALTPKQIGPIELKPYSFGRQLLAGRLCRDVDDIYFRVVQTVWTCTLEKAEALRAMKDIEGSQLQAIDWAEAQGYSLLHYLPLLDIWRRLNQELGASAQVRARDSGDGETPKNAGGPAVP